MLRKSIIDKHKIRYDCNYRHSEDYELWTRLIDLTLFANLPKALFHYRKHENSICSTESEIQNKNAVDIRLKQIKKIGLMPTDAEIKIHLTGIILKNNDAVKTLKEIEIWLMKIKNANLKSGYCAKNSLNKILFNRWHNIAYANLRNNNGVLKIFFQSPLNQVRGQLKIKRYLLLLLKYIRIFFIKPDKR